MKLAAAREVQWNTTAKIPSGYRLERSFTGNSTNALPGLDISVARKTSGGPPTRNELERLHRERVGNTALQSAVVVVCADETVAVFGPDPKRAPVIGLDREHAQQILQDTLSEPSAADARQRLNSLWQAVDSSQLAGVRNSGLFASHELRVGVPQRADWGAACERSRTIVTERGLDLIRALGFTARREGAEGYLLEGPDERGRAIAVLLDESESFDAATIKFPVSPVAYGLRIAQRLNLSWLIMVRSGQIRLYPTSPNLAVGGKGLAETFLELDLPQLGIDRAGYLSLIFSADALSEGGTAYDTLASSAQYAVALGERLRDKVYEEIIPDLSLAVAEQMIDLGYEMDADGLDLAYQITLRIFFRLLFQVYAEDRGLLPYKENDRYTRNALKTLATDFVENLDEEFDPESATLWDDLAQVWNVIDTGDRSWGVPAYNGGLFSSDKELHPHGALISRLRIHNDVMGPVLRALLIDENERDERGPIDFRSLSVREFGTIYEGLLESSLGLAEADLTLDDRGTWLPAKKKSDEIYAYAGQVYFHNTSGQRKGTGSYFTRSFVVEHLLERSLDPALDDHLSRVGELIKKGDQAGAADLFFDFKVADLAMGSGHFLTVAIDHIEAKMAAFLAEDGNQIPGVASELAQLFKAAREAVGPDVLEPEPSSLLRRQIARRCIYGLDINPIAVELARVSIWIHTFVRGLPMSSLDHNLVCGNSLTGIGSVEEALDVLVPGRKGAPTLFDAPIEEALESARTVLIDVARLPELNRKESQAASKAVQQARKESETAKLLFDAAVLSRIGRKDLVAMSDVAAITKAVAATEAQLEIAPLQPAHMPVLFPEVFLRANGGFDVLVGNPPWDKLRHEPTQFWVQKSPGLLNEKDREAAIEKLRYQYPDGAAEEIREIESRELLKRCLKAHFTLQGSGHLEMSKFFAERNLMLLSRTGSIGLVLPGPFCSLDGWKHIRLAFQSSHHLLVTQAENRGGYLFEHVHQQTTVALVVMRPAKTSCVEVTPGLTSTLDFEKNARTIVDISEMVDSEDGGQIPWLGSPLAASVLGQISAYPTLSGGDGWISGGPDTRWDFSGSGRHKDLASKEGSAGAWRVLMTRHVLPYVLSSDDIRKYVGESALEELVTLGSLQKLTGAGYHYPNGSPMITYRFPSSATNSRTLIAAFLPSSGYFYSTGYAHGVRLLGEPAIRDVLALLSVMNSIPCDWWARKLVDRHVGSRIIRALPLPDLAVELRERLAEMVLSQIRALAPPEFHGELEPTDTGSVSHSGRVFDESEVDAIVAIGFGLSRSQVEHVFETFHRGWDYKPRLAAVLDHFDRLEGSS